MNGLRRRNASRWCAHAVIMCFLAGCAGSEKSGSNSRIASSNSTAQVTPRSYGSTTSYQAYSNSADAFNSSTGGYQSGNYSSGYSTSSSSSSSKGGLGGLLLMAGALGGGAMFLSKSMSSSSSGNSGSSSGILDKILGKKKSEEKPKTEVAKIEEPKVEAKKEVPKTSTEAAMVEGTSTETVVQEEKSANPAVDCPPPATAAASEQSQFEKILASAKTKFGGNKLSGLLSKKAGAL